MSDYRRHIYNASKLLGMGIFGIVAVAVLVLILIWPMSLWWLFGESLALAVTLTLVWVAAIQ